MKADTYLSHCYAIPETPSVLPLADEAFASVWKESEGVAAREFLAEIVGRDIASFPLRQEETLRIFFAKTLGGRLPVIVPGNRDDFLRVEALLNGREDLADFPVTVNAFTMQARAKNIRNHRVILLGQAPYSNVPANLLGLDEEEWIERSCRLRFAHECAHYGVPTMKRCGCLGVCRTTPLTKSLQMPWGSLQLLAISAQHGSGCFSDWSRARDAVPAGFPFIAGTCSPGNGRRCTVL